MDFLKKNWIPIILIIVLGFLMISNKKPAKPIVIQNENLKETKNWKTYSNPVYHFSFKYPEGLLSNFQVTTQKVTTQQTLEQVIQNKKDNLTNIEPYKYNVIFGADSWKTNLSIYDFMFQKLPETNNLKRQTIAVGNYKGLRISNLETNSIAYFVYNIFQRKNYIYNFALFSDDPVLINANLPLLEQIISTATFD